MPPELLLSEALKLISRLWLWTFLTSVLLTISFWKRNGSQGHLVKGQIFSADLLTKMTGPSIPLYFELLTPNGALTQLIGFALHYNAQVPRFNSKFAFPGCSGVDALSQDWRDENNWVCPPLSAIIVPSVRALSSCSSYCTLIVPQWPSAYFWPLSQLFQV